MELYDLFAHILEPPGPSLSDQVSECISILAPYRWEAAGLMSRFKTFVDQTPFSRIEEIYAETFSLQGACYPYVGYHLFGDGSHRRMFLAGLEEQYQIYDFSAVQELPDHLGIMLQFLAKDKDGEERDELISLCMIPALKRMLEGLEDRPTPYKEMLQALLLLLHEGETTRNEKMVPEMEEEFSSGE
jgi:nitrate reductase assembly molybdenum cofactor insertion protein NarJ